jgi:hypothetical protein
VPLTQKFAEQSRVWIFPNERTRSTPLDPKLMFWGVSDSFVTAWKSMQNFAKLAPLTRKFAKQSRVWIVCNERIQSTPLNPKTHVLGRFGTFPYCTKIDAKLAELASLMHKFAKWSWVGFFRNKRT